MILLDTSTLIWWICLPEKLSQKARKVIDEAIEKDEILVSSISVWEISLLLKENELGFFIDPNNWLEKVESLPYIRFVPVDNKIAVVSVNLPNFLHKDPADRIIIATALNLGAKLVTSDKKILDYKQVQTIW